jgi:outer membrane protein TolC
MNLLPWKTVQDGFFVTTCKPRPSFDCLLAIVMVITNLTINLTTIQAQPISPEQVVRQIMTNDLRIRQASSSLRLGQLGMERAQADLRPNLYFGPANVGSASAGSGSYGYSIIASSATASSAATYKETHGFGATIAYQQAIPGGARLNASLGTSFLYSLDGGSVQSLAQRPLLSFGLVQPLFVNGAFIDNSVYRAPMRIAEAGLREAETNLVNSINQSIIAGLQLYYQTLATMYNLQHLRIALGLAQHALRIANIRAEQGTMMTAEVWETELAAQNAADVVFNAETAFMELAINLSRLLGLENPVTEADLPPLETANPPDTAAVTGKVPTSPDDTIAVRLARLSTEKLRQQINLEGREFQTTLGLNLYMVPSYPPAGPGGRSATDFAAAFSDFFDAGAALQAQVSVSLNIPLTAGRQRSIQQASQAERLAQATEAEDRARNQASDAAKLLNQRITVAEERRAYWSMQTGLAERRLTESQRLLELGSLTASEVEQSRLLLLQRSTEAWLAATDRFFLELQLRALLGADMATIFGMAPSTPAD